MQAQDVRLRPLINALEKQPINRERVRKRLSQYLAANPQLSRQILNKSDGGARKAPKQRATAWDPQASPKALSAPHPTARTDASTSTSAATLQASASGSLREAARPRGLTAAVALGCSNGLHREGINPRSRREAPDVLAATHKARRVGQERDETVAEEMLDSLRQRSTASEAELHAAHAEHRRVLQSQEPEYLTRKRDALRRRQRDEPEYFTGRHVDRSSRTTMDHRSEFLAGRVHMPAWRELMPGEELLSSAERYELHVDLYFKELDKNGDGIICKAEFAAKKNESPHTKLSLCGSSAPSVVSGGLWSTARDRCARDVQPSPPRTPVLSVTPKLRVLG